MKKVLGIVAGSLLCIGFVVLMGSIFGLMIGPERVAALYEGARPIRPYFLTGLGLVILGVIGISLFGPRPRPTSDEEVRTQLAIRLASLKGAMAEDLEKTLALIMAVDRERLIAAMSLVDQLAFREVGADVILATVRTLCSSSGRPPSASAEPDGSCQAISPASEQVKELWQGQRGDSSKRVDSQG
jgi:hypothetical protein